MKKIIKDAVVILIPVGLIVGGYAAYDSWKLMNSASENRVVKPLPTLPKRETISVNGEKINVLDLFKVLVLDTNGDGVRMYGGESSYFRNPLQFDFNNDGFNEQAFLPGIDDALLLYGKQDLCADYQNESLGARVVGAGLAGLTENADIFAELQKLNGGKDSLTPQDPLYNNLLLWKPGAAMSFDGTFNHCKRRDPLPEDYFSTLAEEKIKTVNLVPATARQVDKYGNILGRYAEVVFENGRRSRLREVWLNTDNMAGSYKQIPVSEEIKQLPDIPGAGVVFSLHQAMQRDQTGKLKELVAKFMAADDFLTQSDLVNQLIYHWTGVAEADPASRKSEDGVNYIGDARKLMAIEKFMGRKFRGTHTGEEETNAPHFQSAPHVLNAYKDFRLLVWSSLLQNSKDLKELFDTLVLKWNKEKQQWIADSSGFAEKLKAYYDRQGEAKTKVLLFMFNLRLSQLNKELGYFGNIGENTANELKKLGVMLPGIDLKLLDQTVILGGGGEDSLMGTAGNDVIAGMEYNDILQGGVGNDLYFYRQNDGFDTITETGGIDTIAFSGEILPQDIEISLDKMDLLVKIKKTPGQGIRIKDYVYAPERRIENLLFAGGETQSLYEKFNQALDNDWLLKSKVALRRFVINMGL